MLKKDQYLNNQYKCSARTVISIIKGKWTLEILSEILNTENAHYTTILKNIPELNPRSLAHNLKKLEHSNIIVKKSQNTNPPQYTYHLTEKGTELRDIFNHMTLWADKFDNVS